jgi:hypothetical protein
VSQVRVDIVAEGGLIITQVTAFNFYITRWPVSS